jgi:hypothetical protein
VTIKVYEVFVAFQENSTDFESQVSAQCDALVDAIHRRKQELLDFVRQSKEMKLRTLKDQVSTCTCKLQHTTGLLQFCIEALKETDSAAFLQVRARSELPTGKSPEASLLQVRAWKRISYR